MLTTVCEAEGFYRFSAGMLRRAVSIDIWYFLREFSSRRSTSASVLLKALSGVGDRPIIVSRIPSSSRPQQCYDHRLRDLVRRTGDLTIATDLGVPRSTARGWLRATPRVVVSLDLAELSKSETAHRRLLP